MCRVFPFPLSLYHYGVATLLLLAGLYMIIRQDNLVRKLIGLSIVQVGVFVLYISLSHVQGGTAPILAEGYTRYASPLPHVLILTAIVVGISTMALGLALVVRIYRAYGSVGETEIQRMERES